MSKDLHNPNAFPSIDAQGFNSIGMSLRDYFAAQAITGILANTFGLPKDPERSTEKYMEKVALQSYGFADEMLKARDQ